jgi:hypothetical protein
MGVPGGERYVDSIHSRDGTGKNIRMMSLAVDGRPNDSRLAAVYVYMTREPS